MAGTRGPGPFESQVVCQYRENLGSSRFPLKGSFKGDIDIVVDVDVDIDMTLDAL